MGRTKTERNKERQRGGGENGGEKTKLYKVMNERGGVGDGAGGGGHFTPS